MKYRIHIADRLNQILHIADTKEIESNLEYDDMLDSIRTLIANSLSDYDELIAMIVYNDITILVIQ